MRMYASWLCPLNSSQFQRFSISPSGRSWFQISNVPSCSGDIPSFLSARMRTKYIMLEFLCCTYLSGLSLQGLCGSGRGEVSKTKEKGKERKVSTRLSWEETKRSVWVILTFPVFFFFLFHNWRAFSITVFALVSRFIQLVAHWLMTLVQRRPLANQDQGVVFQPIRIKRIVSILKLFYFFDRLVIARCLCPTQQRTWISRMLVKSRTCGRGAWGTWWYESNGFIIRKKLNQDEGLQMAR